MEKMGERRRRWPSAVILLAGMSLAGGWREASAAQLVKPASLSVPNPSRLLILVRSTMIALNQANITGNYTVLADLGSAKFRRDNPPAKLAATFEAFRKAKVDISAVALVTPQVTKPPVIGADQQLVIDGAFPTSPMRVKYLLQFEMAEGKWLLSGLNLGLEKFDPSQGN